MIVSLGDPEKKTRKKLWRASMWYRIHDCDCAAG